MPDMVQVYDSASADYRRAFDVFLAHTNEKARLKEYLDRIMAGLPARQVLIDVGAGNGALTAWASERFDNTLAIEPNPSLRADLARRCPQAEVIAKPLDEVSLPPTGDLILCSHVLYYVPQAAWLPGVQRMTTWLAPQGTLLIILQSSECDCSRLLSHFQGRTVDLVPFAATVTAALPAGYQVKLERVSAEVLLPDLVAACTVAEFMLNLLPLRRPVAREQLTDYLQRQFALADGSFRLSVDQDCLLIRQGADKAAQDARPKE